MSKFLVGSYTDERGGLGVSILRLDRESGSLSIEEGVISPDVCGESPSFATIFRDNVFVVSEANPTGLSSYKWKNNSLNFLEKVQVEGSIGCHLSVHEKSESLFYANYWTGDFGVFSCKDGKFLKEIQHLRHSGSGPNAERQEGPHPHGVFIDPSGTRLLVPDLGTDKVYVYSISDEGMLKQHSDFQVESGGGPRHLDFFKDFCFVVTELTSEVYFCSFSVENGLEFQSKFSMIEVLCKISLEFDNSFKFEKNSFYPAAIKVSNNTVFVSVRSFGLKKNFILCFSINEKDKTLKFEKHFFVDGVPRDFYVDEDFLLVAAQSGHTITSIKLDGTKTNQIPCKAPTNILKLE